MRRASHIFLFGLLVCQLGLGQLVALNAFGCGTVKTAHSTFVCACGAASAEDCTCSASVGMSCCASKRKEAPAPIPSETQAPKFESVAFVLFEPLATKTIFSHANPTFPEYQGTALSGSSSIQSLLCVWRA